MIKVGFMDEVCSPRHVLVRPNRVADGVGGGLVRTKLMVRRKQWLRPPPGESSYLGLVGLVGLANDHIIFNIVCLVWPTPTTT